MFRTTNQITHLIVFHCVTTASQVIVCARKWSCTVSNVIRVIHVYSRQIAPLNCY